MRPIITGFPMAGYSEWSSQLIPLWCSMGYEVVLLTDEEPSAEDYELPAGVKRLVLPNCAGIRSGNYEARAEMLEKIIEEEQIVPHGLS